MALIEARGAVVSKNALMARVWPDRIVEENNLQWQISALRAAFGADRNLIRTVSGRGYQFTAEFDTVYGSPEADAGTAIAAAQPDHREARSDEGMPGELPPTNLPEPISELVGREDVLGEILSLAAAHRLVTLTGAGGIGKTRLALAAARRLLPQFADGVWLAEFSPIADPGLVPVTVAAAIGLDLGGGVVTAQRVSQAIAGRRLVLVLDTCEHVIGAAAALGEAVLRAGGTLLLLATSREPLRVEGEWVYPVPPLAVPAEDAEDADDLLRYGGVRLFVERLRAAEPHFVPDRRSAAMIAAICRRLDGIPLAIELAAARAAVLGVEEVATHLDDRFRILTGGRRTALPRHQTLRATLDWSYELLSEPERVILRRLSVFTGAFALEAAGAVATSLDNTFSEVVDSLANLVEKSLVQRESGAIARYRLLDTTRAYALEKLDECGERQSCAHRHAEYYRGVFERAEAEEETLSTTEWLADYGWQIDNLRAALDWAFSPEGHAATGIALTAAAVPLWLHLSLLEECSGRAERALSSIPAEPGRDAGREMKLYAALAISTVYFKGAVHEVSAASRKALEIAEALNDGEYQLRSLWGLCAYHFISGEWRLSLEIAQRIAALAADRPDPNYRATADRIIGFSQHYLGDQASAREHIERMLTNFAPAAGRSHYATRFHFDQRVVARSMLARILWLQGSPDQARRTAESAVEDARATNAITMWGALMYGACPVALWIGDLTVVERCAEMLLDYSTRHGLQIFRALGRFFRGLLLIKRRDINDGLSILRAGFDEAVAGLNAIFYVMFLREMAEGFACAGQVADGLAAVERAIERSIKNEEGWLLGELLRVQGELFLLQGREGAVRIAEDLFRQGLDLARRQGALSWELRAATSLARLLRDQSRSAEGRALLRPVYDRFTEGFDTADLRAAEELLHTLQD